MTTKNSRSSRILEKGLEAIELPTPSEQRMCRAIAAMLAEATKPAKKATKPKGPKLPFGPGELYELVLERVPDKVACEPYDKRWFARLGKELQSIKDLRREDMESIVSYIESGGINYFRNASFSHLIKHFSTWLPLARASTAGQSQMFDDFLDG